MTERHPDIDAEGVLWSAPERERGDRPLLVLLHGFGSHEGDLFELAPFLPLEPVIASVRAPLPQGAGYSWFTGDGEPPTTPDTAASALLAWLDALPAAPSLGVLGFSQGGVTALQLLRLAPRRIDYVVQIAGFVDAGSHAGDETLAELRPPVFWGRGTDDGVISGGAIEHTRRWLPGHAEADIRVYEDLGHAVSRQELVDASAFVAAQLR